MVQTEYIQAKGFIAEVSRTNRIKSATIKVEEGTVKVVVPKALAQEKIAKLLTSKNSWIKEKIALHRQMQAASAKQYISGESFSYLGRNYRLKVNIGLYQPVKLLNGRFTVTLLKGTDNPEMIKDSLTSWFKQRAEAKLTDKVKRYAQIMGVEYKSIGIKSYKSRWGSCSADSDIDFNWLIIMAPNRIVDYVVAHELCHLKHHDHSPKFWRELEKVMPDYAASKEWLKSNGDSLQV